ncbi:MAG: hypothetical protein M3N35_13995 [Candidatus Binatota bacterium]|nr:hypothetical protein [Candidatus Binatota bacterium]
MMLQIVGLQRSDIAFRCLRIEVGEIERCNAYIIAGIFRVWNIETGRHVAPVVPHARLHRFVKQREPLKE